MIKIFQSGGNSGNIHVGSPKPYTVDPKGIDIGGLPTLSLLQNTPVDIDIKGIQDQINKANDLSFKREELAFKYKELEYKEGKEYMDLIGDIFKTTVSAKGAIDSAGGFANLGKYQPIFSDYEKQKANLRAEAIQNASHRNLKGFSDYMIKLGNLETDPNLMSARAETEILNNAFKTITEKPSIGTSKSASQLLSYAFGDETVDFKGVVTDVYKRAGQTVDTKDVTTMWDGFYEMTKPTKVIRKTGEKNAYGQDVEITEFVSPPREETIAALSSRMVMDPVFRAAYEGEYNFEYKGGIDPNITSMATKLYDENKSAGVFPESSTLKGNPNFNLITKPNGNLGLGLRPGTANHTKFAERPVIGGQGQPAAGTGPAQPDGGSNKAIPPGYLFEPSGKPLTQGQRTANSNVKLAFSLLGEEGLSDPTVWQAAQTFSGAKFASWLDEKINGKEVPGIGNGFAAIEKSEAEKAKKGIGLIPTRESIMQGKNGKNGSNGWAPNGGFHDSNGNEIQSFEDIFKNLTNKRLKLLKPEQLATIEKDGKRYVVTNSKILIGQLEALGKTAYKADLSDADVRTEFPLFGTNRFNTTYDTGMMSPNSNAYEVSDYYELFKNAISAVAERKKIEAGGAKAVTPAPAVTEKAKKANLKGRFLEASKNKLNKK